MKNNLQASNDPIILLLEFQLSDGLGIFTVVHGPLLLKMIK